MRQNTGWLRISYWAGAISDGIAAWVMLSQAVLGFESPLTHMIPGIPYRYAMGMAGSLMVGWTILLLWADRKPVERRDVLVITNVVILGLMASGIYAVSSGFAPLSSMAPILIFQGTLIVLFTSSYMISRGGNADKGGQRGQTKTRKLHSSAGRTDGRTPFAMRMNPD